MKRLELIRSQLANKSKSKKLKLDFNSFNPFISYLNDQEKEYLSKAVNTIKELLPEEKRYKYHLEEKVPLEEARKINELFPGLLNGFDGSPYLQTISNYLNYAILVEIGRIEHGLLGLLIVHGRLNIGLISKYASEPQKKQFLPKMGTMEHLSSFCLTEINIGSEAHNIQTTYREVENGYLINGNKRWIGNADMAEILIVMAHNEKNTKEVKAFILEKSLQGKRVKVDVIQNKIASRMVHNCEIYFEDAYVSKENVISKFNTFKEISDCLVEGRLNLSLVALGMMISAFEKTLNYTSDRKQFGVPLTSFQLVQDKLVSIYSQIQAAARLSERVVNLSISDGFSQGKISLLKAWVGKTAHQCMLMARELHGGNGILFENSMNEFVAIQTLMIVEGTTDINTLAAGKDLTGVSSYY